MTPPRRMTARDPRTGRRDYAFDAVGYEAVRTRAASLRAAQPGWAALGMEGRCAVLRAFASGLDAVRPDLLAALEVDTGRGRLGLMELQAVTTSIDAWAAIAGAGGERRWTPGRREPHIRHTATGSPYPLVACLAPWNFPLLLGMIDATPALLAGCAVMLKPSEITPRFAAPLARAVAATPALAEVFSVILGDGHEGEAMVDQADAVALTGSVATGRRVAARAAARLIPAFLELGGKDPMIVLDGADLERSTDAALRGAVVASGQACQSIERIYVAHALHDTFLARLAAKAAALRLNWPDIAIGDIGPIISEAQASILAAHIADARVHGGQVLTGGEIETFGGGLWLRPTVIAGAHHAMRVMREETFGPILPVMAFDTVDEAVGLANDSDYGLSAAVFGPTLDAAEAVGRRLDAGAISLNDAALTALFHEAPKQAFGVSGLGPSRMGADGLRRFLRQKALIANTGPPVPMHALSEDG